MQTVALTLQLRIMSKKVRLSTILIAYASFIALGLFDGLIGVAWPSVRLYFGQTLGALGVISVGLTTGHILASVLNGRMVARRGIAFLLPLSSGIMVLGTLLQTVAWIWPALLLGTVLLGAGMGMLDAGMNTFAASEFRPKLLNWLHASFSIGTTIGAFVMTLVVTNALSWRYGFGFIGLALILITVVFWFTQDRWGTVLEVEDNSAEIKHADRPTLRLPIVWISIIVFLLHTAIEVSIGNWNYSLFTLARGIPIAQAGLWATLYWGSLTTGRILIGFVDVRPTRIVRIGLGGLLLGTLLLSLNVSWLGLVGLIISGLSIAPIFPALIAATPIRLGKKHAANAIGYQIAAAGLGSAVGPGTAGILADTISLNAVPPFIFGMVVVMFGLHEWLVMRSR